MEIALGVANALSLAKDVYEVGEKLKNMELKKLAAELKLEVLAAQTEIAQLKLEVEELKRTAASESGGERCPRCSKRSFALQRSEPDEIFGVLGRTRRYFKCTSCDYEESKLHG